MLACYHDGDITLRQQYIIKQGSRIRSVRVLFFAARCYAIMPPVCVCVSVCLSVVTFVHSVKTNKQSYTGGRRKFHGAKILRTFAPWERKFHGNESSLCGLFDLRNESARERKFRHSKSYNGFFKEPMLGPTR